MEYKKSLNIDDNYHHSKFSLFISPTDHDTTLEPIKNTQTKLINLQ